MTNESNFASTLINWYIGYISGSYLESALLILMKYYILGAQIATKFVIYKGYNMLLPCTEVGSLNVMFNTLIFNTGI